MIKNVPDKIEKQIEINAPASRVWRAITDHHEYGQWFGVKLDGPFLLGETVRGQVTVEGYEHFEWVVTVKAMQPEHHFAFAGHPNAVDPEADYSAEQDTLVEFMLEPSSKGTWLTIRESGFSALPAGRRESAYIGNEEGWTVQIKNIADYVESRVA